MKIVGYCIYRSLVNIISLKSAANFMNATCVDGKRAQVHEMHRARYICFGKKFKQVKHDIISKQFDVAIRFIKDEKQFCHFSTRTIGLLR